MKLNRKGFTLVELLAVMVILISISLIVVSNITESLVRREEKEYVEQQELAIGAAKIYFSLENKSCVTIKTLRDKDYFENRNRFGLLNEKDEIRLVLVEGTVDEYEYKYVSLGNGCS